MAKAKPTSLRDDVLSRITVRRRGFLPWNQRLPDDLRAELDAIRDEWQAGAIQSEKRGLAVVIAEIVAERGHQKPGEQAVIAWLGKRP